MLQLTRADMNLLQKTPVPNELNFFDIFTTFTSSEKWLDVVYLDLSKAFDSVSYDILFNKIVNYGLE